MSERIEFVDLLVTFNQGDIAFIISILKANGIIYHIEGENFLAVRPLVAPARIMVDRSRLEEAKELLKDFKSGHFGYQVD